LAEYPAAVQRRILALKKLQYEAIQLDAQFHQNVYNLETTFQARYNEVRDKRASIITGCYDPSQPEELKVPGLNLPAIAEKTEENGDSVPAGIPEFWLTVMKSVGDVRRMIRDYDEPILKVSSVSQSNGQATDCYDYPIHSTWWTFAQ